jgi:hypothetical protein
LKTGTWDGASFSCLQFFCLRSLPGCGFAVLLRLPNRASAAFNHLLKKGDSSIYHYEFTRASKTSPWKLQKAWRADQNDHTVEEYPVP